MTNDYSAVVEKIKPSIAVVFSIDAENKVYGKGSAFVFGGGNSLVTCNHVVKKEGSKVLLKFSDKDEFIDAKVVIRDEEHDLALLIFDGSSRQPLIEPKKSEVKEGMSVIFSGYPLDLLSLTTHQGVLSAIIKDPAGVTTYLIDGTVNEGNSGCP